MKTNITEKEVIEELKKFEVFPNEKTLRKQGKGRLGKAIQKLGGYNYFRSIFNLPIRKTWNEEDILKSLSAIIIDDFPTQLKLVEMGHNDLLTAISRNGGINYYRQKMGYDPQNLKIDMSLETIKELINPLVINNVFPTVEHVVNNLGSRVVSAIKKHGGFVKVAGLLGFKSPHRIVTSDGHHVQSYREYVFDELLYNLKIPHEVGGLINSNFRYRYDFKIEDCFIEIWGFRKTETTIKAQEYNKTRTIKENLYKKLNLKLIPIDAEVFDLKYNDMIEYFVNVLNKFETNNDIKDSVSHVIHSSYWNEEKILVKLREIMNAEGTIPGSNGLTHSLKRAIENNGGINKFYKLLGCKIKKRDSEFWNDDTILDELKLICDETGYFPTPKQMRVMEKSYLIPQIRFHGGINKFQKLLGYKPKRNRKR